VARIYLPENRLKKILLSQDAPTAGELVAAAEGRVAGLEGRIRAYVAEKQKEIAAFATKADDILFAECRALGDAALNVAEVAGAAGLDDVGEVSRGISAMVDSLVTSGVWHTDALRLHIDALALLDQGAEADEAKNALVLQRLRIMREAIGIPE
jgi:hypothetical protein